MEGFEECETVEIASIHAVSRQAVEKMAELRKRLDEHPSIRYHARKVRPTVPESGKHASRTHGSSHQISFKPN